MSGREDLLVTGGPVVTLGDDNVVLDGGAVLAQDL